MTKKMERKEELKELLEALEHDVYQLSVYPSSVTAQEVIVAAARILKVLEEEES